MRESLAHKGQYRFVLRQLAFPLGILHGGIGINPDGESFRFAHKERQRMNPHHQRTDSSVPSIRSCRSTWLKTD